MQYFSVNFHFLPGYSFKWKLPVHLSSLTLYYIVSLQQNWRGVLIGQRKEVCFGGGGASLWLFVSICSMTFALWSLLSPAHPQPVHIHHTSGLLWQHSPLTFLRHLHLLLIKWTGSDPPSGGADREKDGVAMISSRRKWNKVEKMENCHVEHVAFADYGRLLSWKLQDCHGNNANVSLLMTLSFVHNRRNCNRFKSTLNRPLWLDTAEDYGRCLSITCSCAVGGGWGTLCA